MDRLGKDVLFHIATMLDLDDLLSLCKSGKEMNKLICLEKFIWNHRLKYEFPDWEKNINREKLDELLLLIKKDARFNILIDSKQQFIGPFDSEDKSEFERNVYLLLVKLSKLKNEMGYQGSIYQLFEGRRLELSKIRMAKGVAKIPPEIGLLTNLRVLIFEDSGLRKIPPEIGLLTNLLILSLRNNNIKSIPPEIGQLTDLRELYLDGNKIKTLPPEIGRLTNLGILWVHNNNIKTLPDDIYDLKILRHLYIDERTKNVPDRFLRGHV